MEHIRPLRRLNRILSHLESASNLNHPFQVFPVDNIENSVCIDSHELFLFVQKLFEKQGSSHNEAQIVASHLVEANLQGHDSHGVGVVQTYYKIRKKGLLKPNTSIQIVSDKGALLAFDGNRGYGQVIAKSAVEIAIQRAKKYGVCVYTLRNSGHIGRVGTYAEMAVKQGLVYISLADVTDHPPAVAPFSGTDSRIGTNPVTIGIPVNDQNPPVILDMATSKVSLGKVRIASTGGKRLENGCIIDSTGKPTNDPSVMFPPVLEEGEFIRPTGSLCPAGGYKGAGLALVCSLLITIGGGKTIQPGNKKKGSIINNKFAIVVDPSKFGELGPIGKEMAAMIRYWKESPPVKGEYVYFPGEPELKKKRERLKSGIRLDGNIWSQLIEIANEYNVAIPQLD